MSFCDECCNKPCHCYETPEYLELKEELKQTKALLNEMAVEATCVCYNVATTEGTKTNSEMPKWFLLRVEDLAKVLKKWEERNK